MAATLRELADRFHCVLHGSDSTEVDHVASLENAGPGALCFLANPRYRQQLQATRASAVVLEARYRDLSPVPCLVSTNPYADYARIAETLHPRKPVSPGIAPSAVVAPGARIDDSAEIAARAVIGEDCVIEESVYVGPGCFVAARVAIGRGTRLAAHVTVLDGVRIGARCIFHPGVVVGADGFGFARDHEVWLKVPQLGAVVIGDDVEIGANTTIDRGAIDDTVIEDGVKLDNLVHIAHNVHVGAHTAIAGTAAIAGSSRVGRRCMIAGGAGILGQLEVCDDVVILARSLVTHSIASPGVYSGSLPAEEAAEWRRNAVRFKQLDDYANRLRALERRIGCASKRRPGEDAGENAGAEAGKDSGADAGND